MLLRDLLVCLLARLFRIMVNFFVKFLMLGRLEIINNSLDCRGHWSLIG